MDALRKGEPHALHHDGREFRRQGCSIKKVWRGRTLVQPSVESRISLSKPVVTRSKRFHQRTQGDNSPRALGLFS